MSHPLLTKVLTERLASLELDFGYDYADLAAGIVDDMPHADRLERALDVCRECGVEHAVHFPGTLGHPYVPLVQP